MLFFGLCCGLAGIIKPTALLFALIVLPLFAAEWRQPRRWLLSRFYYLMGGLLLPWAAMCLWLWRHGALAAFVETANGLMRFHAGMARHTVGFLLTHALPTAVLPLFIPALVLLLLRADWRLREQQMVLTGMACGLASFCLQGKAYPYHRYPLLAFLLLFVVLEIGPAFRMRTARPHSHIETALGLFVLAYGTLWLAPSSVAKALRYDWRSQPTLMQMQADLTAIGDTFSDGLNSNVQCLDTMAGCITVLDRLKLSQSTGLLYDCYLFAPDGGAIVQNQRRRFTAQLVSAPPRVFVVTNQWCLTLPGGYGKLNQWPEFAAYLNRHYDLALERSWHAEERRRLAT